MRPSLSNAVSFIEEGDLESLAAALAEVPALMAQQEESGDTLLHHACQQKFDAAVALLLEAGASAHARGFFGRTPLHCAVLDTDASRAAPVVSRLLAAGADPRMKDEAGFDVIALARKEVWAPQAEVLDLFGARSSAQPNTATFEATRAVVEGIERRSHTELAVSRVLEARRLRRWRRTWARTRPVVCASSALSCPVAAGCHAFRRRSGLRIVVNDVEEVISMYPV